MVSCRSLRYSFPYIIILLTLQYSKFYIFIFIKSTLDKLFKKKKIIWHESKDGGKEQDRDEIDEEKERNELERKYICVSAEIPWLLQVPSFTVCLFVFPRSIHLTEQSARWPSFSPPPLLSLSLSLLQSLPFFESAISLLDEFLSV